MDNFEQGQLLELDGKMEEALTEYSRGINKGNVRCSIRLAHYYLADREWRISRNYFRIAYSQSQDIEQKKHCLDIIDDIDKMIKV